MGYRADKEREQKTFQESIPEIWWYEPIVYVIMKNLESVADRIKIFKNSPLTMEQLIEKRAVSKIEQITITVHFFKLKNACIELNDFDAENIIKNKVNGLFEKIPMYDWMIKWVESFETNVTWGGFDNEILFPSSMRAEQAATKAALEFREKRGFKWKWRNDYSRIESAI